MNGTDLPKTKPLFRDYGGLHEIKSRIDYSKTRHPQIFNQNGYEVSIFCDKNGNQILEKHVSERGGVSYYYNGHDVEGTPAKIELHDFDGDGNIDEQVETLANGRSYSLRSSKDNGQFDTIWENGKMIIDARKQGSLKERIKNFLTKLFSSGD